MSGSPAEPPSGGSSSNTILIIEADILLRMVVAEYLRECGYKVIEGVAGAEAVAVLEAGTRVDALLVDVQLPGEIDAFTLARRVRGNYPEIDVILTSGTRKAVDRATDLCEEGPLEKPYHPQEVLRRIQMLREKRRQRQQS